MQWAFRHTEALNRAMQAVLADQTAQWPDDTSATLAKKLVDRLHQAELERDAAKVMAEQSKNALEHLQERSQLLDNCYGSGQTQPSSATPCQVKVLGWEDSTVI